MSDEEEEFELPEDFPYSIEQLEKLSEAEVIQLFEEYAQSKESLSDSDEEGPVLEEIEGEETEEQVEGQKSAAVAEESKKSKRNRNRNRNRNKNKKAKTASA